MSSFFTSIKIYGFKEGIKMFLYLKFKRKKKLAIPRIQHLINLRSKTNDYSVVKQIFTRSEYEFDYESLINYPKVIVDAGAHIGIAAIFFTNKFPNSKIISIEPGKDNYKLLLENTREYPNIIPCNYALWNKKTSVNIIDSGEGEWAYMVQESNTKDTTMFAQAITMNDLMKKHNIQNIDILKMDIEGSEKEIFSENCNLWLVKTKLIVIELHDWKRPGSSIAFIDAMKQNNFSLVLQNGENFFYINSKYVNPSKT